MENRRLIIYASLLFFVFLAAYLGYSSSISPKEVPTPPPPRRTAAPPVEEGPTEKEKAAKESLNTLKGMASNMRTTMVTADELREKMRGNESSFAVFDLRTKKEFSKGHIKGATHLPFDEFPEKLNTLPKDKTLVLYCATGQMSAAALTSLKLAGYENIYTLFKGYNDPELSRAGFTIQR
ncbi:rhodanese-like domain-containing protein [Heliophilum fasciatum]|uniref:Rhodanese-related sulfurtransferase n=1 Tax=Heliophilum fasciatum TaxID=35700 RepID=A0A4V2SY46_9FIRM|nr:rhodanese-like domain-containing protein [Heliophilum fasciatum]MCW2276843.1 rhodanese-related sulfurtransferase [Heliophilum fasciatum]TCP68696.1 rhodanese-related sulfurtransferase [Heliophilum fasciatum]